jgi:hypothetical protein
MYRVREFLPVHELSEGFHFSIVLTELLLPVQVALFFVLFRIEADDDSLILNKTLRIY